MRTASVRGHAPQPCLHEHACHIARRACKNSHLHYVTYSLYPRLALPHATLLPPPSSLLLPFSSPLSTSLSLRLSLFACSPKLRFLCLCPSEQSRAAFLEHLPYLLPRLVVTKFTLPVHYTSLLRIVCVGAISPGQASGFAALLLSSLRASPVVPAQPSWWSPPQQATQANGKEEEHL